MGGAVGTDSTAVAVPLLGEVRRNLVFPYHVLVKRCPCIVNLTHFGPYIMVNRFCRAMLCISAAIAGMWCLSVRPSVCHVRVEDLRPHSIILASCKPGCKPGFRPGWQPGFRQFRAVCDMLLPFFVENLVANLLHQSRHVEIDAACSQQVRWFVRVLDERNVEKNAVRASQRTC